MFPDLSRDHVSAHPNVAHQVLIERGKGVLYSHNGGSGELFRFFLTDYYPWDDEPNRTGLSTGVAAARVLWKEYRNPFAHELGLSVQKNRKGARRMVLERHAVKVKCEMNANETRHTGPNESAVQQLEADARRPRWLPATLVDLPHKRVLTVEALYWGVRRAVLSLCEDSARMESAATFISSAKKT